MLRRGPADDNSRHRGQGPSPDDRIAHEQRDDQNDNRQEQEYTAHHGAELGQLIFAHPAHAQFGGLKIDHKVDRSEIEDRRDDRRNGDVGVGDARDLGHDEGACPHDRRHDLPTR